jgi:hypothetical protein
VVKEEGPEGKQKYEEDGPGDVEDGLGGHAWGMKKDGRETASSINVSSSGMLGSRLYPPPIDGLPLAGSTTSNHKPPM